MTRLAGQTGSASVSDNSDSTCSASAEQADHAAGIRRSIFPGLDAILAEKHLASIASATPAPTPGASAKPLDSRAPCAGRFPSPCAGRFSATSAPSQKPRNHAGFSKPRTAPLNVPKKILYGVAPVEVFLLTTEAPFKRRTRLSSRQLHHRAAILKLAAHHRSPTTHEVTLTPKGRQTVKDLLDQLCSYYRRHVGEPLSYAGVSTKHPYPHGHFGLSLVKGSHPYDVVQDFLTGINGAPDRRGAWLYTSNDVPLGCGHIQPLSVNCDPHGRTNLPGALGKIGYAVDNLIDMNSPSRRKLPGGKVHASKDIRRLADRMSEHGFDAPLEPTIDTETSPAASPIIVELPPAWRAQFEQDKDMLVRVTGKLVADGDTATIRAVMEGWCRHYGFATPQISAVTAH